MKIAICDDDQAVIKQLSRLIRKYAGEHIFDYTILEFDHGMKLLDAARTDPDIQIMFLDIYMEPMSGMDLAEALRKEENDSSIIFVTISKDHYARSYEVYAQHYLVKPITYEQVVKALDRCKQRLTAAASYATFAAGGRYIRVPLRQIRFAEVFRNQTVVHAAADISLRCPLETVIRQLSDPRFLRTQSRACKKNFEKSYGQFLTEAMTGGIL